MKNAIKRIDNKIFKSFRYLKQINLQASYFKKLIHTQGIEWIRSINHEVYVNVSDPSEYALNKEQIAYVAIIFNWGSTFEDVFPDSDFCLWSNFPFSQMVEINEIINYGTKFQYNFLKPTCLYWWLNQYYLLDKNKTAKVFCDYEKLLSLCDKNDFRASFSFVWDMSETRSLSKGLQIFLTISSYLISVFGIITNSILIYLIWSKNTRDSFKCLKHYRYLGMISICNIIIFLIGIFSWISDCKETLQVFCPETRRFIAIQFFKVRASYLKSIFFVLKIYFVFKRYFLKKPSSFSCDSYPTFSTLHLHSIESHS